ncbi:cytochrome c oxidase assembly protein [Plantactinospora sp. GCM10030261]|uniref:cytochrome c oxidase assembly protein n=1 Tax=Plantactinospora sp. GCM10030261 TaxID=3273420 RepID=UPI003608C1B2
MRRRATLLIAAGLAVAVLVLVVQSLVVGQPYAVLGVGDAGWPVRLATPLVRLLTTVSATVCVGSLVFATFLTRPQPSGVVAPAGYAALRTAARAAAVWATAALVMVPLDAADKAGVTLDRAVEPGGLVVLVDAIEAPKAWLTTAGCAAVVAVGCWRTLRWSAGAGLTLLAVLALVPPLVVGHAASEEGHDIATAALLIHVPAAAVWIGTLVAVSRARHDGLTDDVWRRYRRLAARCAVVVGASGLVEAAVLAADATAVTTGYGTLLVVKVVAFIILGLVLVSLAGRIAGRYGVGVRARARMVAGELVLGLVAYGLSVALTRVPAPKLLVGQATGHETLIGYNLTVPPTPLNLLTEWRPEVLYTSLAAVLAVAYLALVRRVRAAGRVWPRGRTVAWCGGCLVLLVATSSGLGRYAPGMFSLQTVSHMVLGMLVPVLLVLAAPFTLAAAALPPASTDRLPGAGDWVEWLRACSVARVLTHPFVGTIIFSGAPFLVYFTSLFEISIRYHWAHVAVHGVFLVIGFGFAWLVVGVDQLPRVAPGLSRLGALMTAMPLCVAFGAAILGSADILGNGFASGNLYTALDLPWVRDLAADQRLGGYLALAIGEACMLLMLVILVVRWGGMERRQIDICEPAGFGDVVDDDLTRVRRPDAAATPSQPTR